MDPYLERPALWQGVHRRLVPYIADDLQPQLPPHYVAAIEERVLAQQGYIEIHDLEGREVVTVIEMLSPSNKANSLGRDDYLLQQQQVLLSQPNFVEIDLLRQGLHTVAAPAVNIARLGPADYLICTRRTARPTPPSPPCEGGGSRGVLRLTVRDSLPHVAIPLREGEADVVLHLAKVFTRCYDNGAYARRLDYTQEPDPPLRPDDVAWADELLRQHGLRPAAG
jgi:hypothetical protein